MDKYAIDTYIAAPIPPRNNAPRVGPRLGRTSVGVVVEAISP